MQIWSGGTGGEGDWDGHKECDKNHVAMAAKTDKPIAALLTDSKSRGMLESTLMVWAASLAGRPCPMET